MAAMKTRKNFPDAAKAELVSQIGMGKLESEILPLAAGELIRGLKERRYGAGGAREENAARKLIDEAAGGKLGDVVKRELLGVELHWAGCLLSQEPSKRRSALAYYDDVKLKGAKLEKELALDVLSEAIRFEAVKANESRSTSSVLMLAEALDALGDARGAEKIREAAQKIESYGGMFGFRESAEKLKRMAGGLAREPERSRQLEGLYKLRDPYGC